MDTRPDGGDEAMEQQRQRLVEELRMAERAQELLAGLEWHLKNGDRADLENHLVQLDRLAGSLPEGNIVRQLVGDAAEYARARGAGKAGSVNSYSTTFVHKEAGARPIGPLLLADRLPSIGGFGGSRRFRTCLGSGRRIPDHSSRRSCTAPSSVGGIAPP